MTNSNRRWRKAQYLIRDPGGWERVITVSGRERWALETLMAAGATGCTSLTAPAHRLASYVCRLRDKGVLIVTEREQNDGEFPGVHGKYILLAKVVRIEPEASE